LDQVEEPKRARGENADPEAADVRGTVASLVGDDGNCCDKALIRSVGWLAKPARWDTANPLTKAAAPEVMAGRAEARLQGGALPVNAEGRRNDAVPQAAAGWQRDAGGPPMSIGILTLTTAAATTLEGSIVRRRRITERGVPTRLAHEGMLSSHCGIGYIWIGAKDSEHSTRDGLRQGLRDLGYVEGHDFVLEERYADSQPDRLPQIVTELMRLNVALFLSPGVQVTRALVAGTSTIPIIATTPDLLSSGNVE
jgi:hypothetical protein